MSPENGQHLPYNEAVSRSDLTIPVAASVVLWRSAGTAAEVLVVRRSPRARFMSGFLAFPGGRHEPGDGPLPDAARQTAIRETFEEVGVLLDPADLLDLGVWRTPDYLVTPMLTHFYLCAAAEGLAPALPPGSDELVDLAWRRPADVLAEWEAGRCLLAPPTRFLLRILAEGHLDAAARALSAPESHGNPPRYAPIRPEIVLFPVRTPTLPPATHTNTYIAGRERLIVVDPASPYEDAQGELAAHLDARLAAGARLEAAVLSHAHHDHVAGAVAVARRYGVPILAHPDAAAKLPFAARPSLAEGGLVPAGDLPLEVVHTPGHAPGHVVLWEPHTRTAIAGDLVAGVGTILVDPDEGSMAEYLSSLARVRAMAPAALLPSHGGVIGGAVEKLTEYIDHRLWREARVRAALEAGAAPLEALVTRVYDDVAPAVWPIALLSLRAHLYKLREEGLASESEAGWGLTSGAGPAV